MAQRGKLETKRFATSSSNAVLRALARLKTVRQKRSQNNIKAEKVSMAEKEVCKEKRRKPKLSQNKPRLPQAKPKQPQKKPRLAQKKPTLPKWKPRIPHKKEYRVIARPRKGRKPKAKVLSRLGFFYTDNMPKYRNFSNINGTGKKRRNYHAVVSAEDIIAQIK